MRSAVLALVLVFTVACGGDNFSEVQRTDTIEAYETYLANNAPDRNTLFQAQTRLEELYLEKAKADKTLESYDLYLEKFPEGKLREGAVAGREEFLFAWSKEQNTPEGWQKFLDEYPRADKKRKADARMALRVAEYAPSLAVAEPVIEEINMSEAKDGEADGWAWKVEVTNNGDQSLRHLALTIKYRDAEGVVVGQKEWPVVSDNWKVPMPDEAYEPIAPGKSRTWEWSEAFKRLPEGWDPKSVEIAPTAISFLE